MEAQSFVRIILVVSILPGLLSTTSDFLMDLVLRILLVDALHLLVPDVAETAVHYI